MPCVDCWGTYEESETACQVPSELLLWCRWPPWFFVLEVVAFVGLQKFMRRSSFASFRLISDHTPPSTESVLSPKTLQLVSLFHVLLISDHTPPSTEKCSVTKTLAIWYHTEMSVKKKRYYVYVNVCEFLEHWLWSSF